MAPSRFAVALLSLQLLAFSPLATTLNAQGGPPPPPPLQALQPPLAPPGNPMTMEKARLGRVLFWDEQLSSTRTVACGTCHVPEAAGSDLRTLQGVAGITHPGSDGLFGSDDDITASPGVPRTAANGRYLGSPNFGLGPRVTPRKAPSIINAAYAPELMWDGRASGSFVDPVDGSVVLPLGAALESQALLPILSDREMAHVNRDWPEVAARLVASDPLALSPQVGQTLEDWIDGRSYPELFEEVFGDPSITPVRIAQAIATYERRLVSDQTPWDAALAGVQPLSPLEQQGRQVFVSMNCNSCHRGNRLTDDAFHNTGVRPNGEDPGRFVVTGQPGDRNRFRTPGLRNVELRAPYFHNGSMATLEDVLEFYDRGGDFNAPNKAPQVVPLGMTPQQKTALLAFLRRPLTDLRVQNVTAPFNRPRLFTESMNVPTQYGMATAGGMGLVPQAIALEPLHWDQSETTLAVEDARPGAMAFLLLDIAPGAGLPLFGISANLAFTQRLIVLPAMPTGVMGPAQGATSVTLPWVLATEAIGATIFAQWVVVDPGSPAGTFSATRGIRMRVF